MVVIPIKRKRMCEECEHIHREDVYCHVYVEAADGEDAEDYVSESESSSSSDSDDSDVSLGIPTQALTAQMSTKAVKMRPLLTPKYVKQMGFIRCNCKIGVPSESKRFEPMQRYVYCGNIQIQTYSEINYPSDRARYLQTLDDKYPESQRQRREIQRISDIAENLPHILSYLPLGSCSPVPQVSTYWNYGTSLYQRYIDMRNCVPWQAYRAHQTQVDSVLVVGKFVYSGGDRRVIVSDYRTGEICSTITRDSGNIPVLFEKDQEIFICSTNGSIRTYALTHSGQNIKMVFLNILSAILLWCVYTKQHTNLPCVCTQTPMLLPLPHINPAIHSQPLFPITSSMYQCATMWDHSRSISHVLPGLRSVGICAMHGMNNHICSMYTASEDRYMCFSFLCLYC